MQSCRSILNCFVELHTCEMWLVVSIEPQPARHCLLTPCLLRMVRLRLYSALIRVWAMWTKSRALSSRVPSPMKLLADLTRQASFNPTPSTFSDNRTLHIPLTRSLLVKCTSLHFARLYDFDLSNSSSQACMSFPHITL